MSRTTSQQREADRAERDAFDHALAPCSGEILQAARREVRHRLALGQFAPDDPDTGAVVGHRAAAGLA
jgi:hypothetical protein